MGKKNQLVIVKGTDQIDNHTQANKLGGWFIVQLEFG
jgi:hypothetical protein